MREYTRQSNVSRNGLFMFSSNEGSSHENEFPYIGPFSPPTYFDLYTSTLPTQYTTFIVVGISFYTVHFVFNYKARNPIKSTQKHSLLDMVDLKQTNKKVSIFRPR